MGKNSRPVLLGDKAHCAHLVLPKPFPACVLGLSSPPDSCHAIAMYQTSSSVFAVCVVCGVAEPCVKGVFDSVWLLHILLLRVLFHSSCVCEFPAHLCV